MAPGSSARNVALVERLWHAMHRGGLEAVIELTDDDCVWQPFGAGGRRLRGHDELRRYFAGRARAGVLAEAHAYAFEPVGDACVLVSGALRVTSERGLEDRQLFWLYHVSDGRLTLAESFKTRAAAMAAARVDAGSES